MSSGSSSGGLEGDAAGRRRPASGSSLDGELLLLFTNPIAAAIEYQRNNLGKFIHSINVGTGDAVREADDEFVDCPQSSLVMIGYSQGAMAMHQAELQLRAHHPRVFHRIVGTLLLADGDRVPDTRAREFGSSSARAEGIRPYPPLLDQAANRLGRKLALTLG